MNNPFENYGKKGCRACTSFMEWTGKMVKKELDVKDHNECPLDKDELGRSTWGFLHTMAAYYPDNPTETEKSKMIEFINIFSQFYPCKPCSEHLQQSLKLPEMKIDVSSQRNFSQWLCRLHNNVNTYLNKPVFDCNLVDERWKDGWKDGSCD